MAVGRHPLLSIFEGLDEVPAFQAYPGTPAQNRRILRRTYARILDSDGWMYVAPHDLPGEFRQAGYELFTSSDDEIVISRAYLRAGRAMDLYLDALHEFLHILQRKKGRDLWPMAIPYVDRPTEVEAYAFSVAEARRLGARDPYLRRYLRVSWVTAKEHHRLLSRLHVAPVVPRHPPAKRTP